MTTQEMNPIETQMNPSEMRVHAYQTIQTLTAAITHDVELSFNDTRALVAAAALGSALLEGAPGTGKTLAANTLAKAMSGKFHRVQGSPENQPSGLLGYELWHPGKMEMLFRPGPGLLANVLLADELNRNTEKFQAAFLELMGEGQVTVGEETYFAQNPLTIIATQNPIEEPGTNPLPRAELDRFALSIQMEQSPEDEQKIMDRYLMAGEKNENIVSLAAVRGLRLAVKKVEVPADMRRFLLAIKDGVAQHEAVDPLMSILDGRAKLRLADLARFHALARAEGAANVQPEDIYWAAQYVLLHRIELTYEAKEDHLEKVAALKQNRAKTELTADPAMNVIHEVLRKTA